MILRILPVALLVLASSAFALDGQIGIHDPSTLIKCNGKFYVYGTGGTPLVSDDGWTWRPGAAPPVTGLAPDVIRLGDRYYMYIARNVGGQPRAEITLISNRTLDPESPDFKWENGGVVASSDGVEDCNAIDPGLLLEPIPGDGRVIDSAVQAAAKKEYFSDQFSVLPRAGDKVTVNGAGYVWHAVDSSHHNVNLHHFASFLGKPTANVVFWGVTIVESPEEVSGVRLAVGSNAGSVWWVNGQEAVGIYGDRQTSIDDGVSRKLTLKKGPNIVRFIVVQNGGMVDCCARFLDATDQPLTRLTQTLTAFSHR